MSEAVITVMQAMCTVTGGEFVSMCNLNEKLVYIYCKDFEALHPEHYFNSFKYNMKLYKSNWDIKSKW